MLRKSIYSMINNKLLLNLLFDNRNIYIKFCSNNYKVNSIEFETLFKYCSRISKYIGQITDLKPNKIAKIMLKDLYYSFKFFKDILQPS